MSEYSVQRVDSESFHLLIPLMKDSFGMDVNIDYFRWKYLDNPAGQFIGFIAIENSTGEVGAYYGVIPELYSIDGEERIIYQSCDTMTHSGHRRRGLFQKLAVHCYDYIQNNRYFFIIGFGGGQSTPGFIKFGWKVAFNFRYYFKPYLLCRLSGVRKYAPKLFCEDEKTENLAPLLQTLIPKDVVKSIRTVEHLKWRIKNPHYRYKVVSYKTKGILSGYVIYYVHQGKLFLFDFVFRSADSRKALLWYLSDIVSRNRYKGIIAFCAEQGAAAAELKQSFFISNPFGRGPLHELTPFIFYTDKMKMAKFYSPRQWDISSYDHDAL